MTPNELRAQESLRNHVYDKRTRWNDLLARIRWAEQKVKRATPAACIAKQRLFERTPNESAKR